MMRFELCGGKYPRNDNSGNEETLLYINTITGSF